MAMAINDAKPMALNVFSLNAVSALVSKASLPRTHRRTVPILTPSLVTTGSDTAPS